MTVVVFTTLNHVAYGTLKEFEITIERFPPSKKKS